MLKRWSYLFLGVLAAAGWLSAGCSEHPLGEEVSLEDAAKMYISESTVGVGLYGPDIIRADTLTGYAPRVSTDSIRWAAHWDFHGHSFPLVAFDTTTDRGVPGLRSAELTIWDTAMVTISLIVDADSVIKKTNRTVAKTAAFLVQLGAYGDSFHGWVLRQAAYRSFIGPGGISPSFVYVNFNWSGNTWNPSAGLFSIDDITYLSRGDTVTVRVATIDTTNVLFLNTTDSGTTKRRQMLYDSGRHEFVSGWRVADNARSRDYHQAFVEAYSMVSLTSPDSLQVGAAGQNFLYRIE